MPDRHASDDPLAERLAALSTGPVPPLAGADEVRGRGGQRRRRQQAALACAAVLVAASIGGTAALLSGTGGQDALRTAQAPTDEPTMCAEPTAPGFVTSSNPCGEGGPTVTCEEPLGVPPETDGEVVRGGVLYAQRGEGGCPPPPSASSMTCAEWLAHRSKMIEVRGPTCVDRGSPPRPPLAAEPSADPTPTPTSSGESDPTWDLAAGFLSPEQAGQVEQPGWSVDAAHTPAPGPLLDPCATGDFPGEPVESAERAMGSERETGGSRLVQEVLRYPGEQQAADAFDAFAASVEQCPEAAAVEGQGVNRFEVAGRGGVNGSRTLLVLVTPCDVQVGCMEQFRSYLMLVQDGDGLTDAFYGIGEDGDPAQPAADLLDAVAAQLVRTVRG